MHDAKPDAVACQLFRFYILCYVLVLGANAIRHRRRYLRVGAFSSKQCRDGRESVIQMMRGRYFRTVPLKPLKPAFYHRSSDSEVRSQRTRKEGLQ